MKSIYHLANSDHTATPEMSGEGVLTRRVRLGAWIFMVLAGVIETVVLRHTMQDDVVNYLDLGVREARDPAALNWLRLQKIPRRPEGGKP